jgi:beta-fructofuranosidase
LWLRDDLRLGMRPIEELKGLRYNERKAAPTVLNYGKDVELKDLSGDAVDLELSFDPGAGSIFGVKVRCAADGSEETVVGYDVSSKQLFVDTTRSSAAGMGLKVRESGPLTLKPGEQLKLRVLLDKSVIEVFANDRQAITRRIYPAAGSRRIKAFSTGGASQLTSAVLWDMMPSNPY